MTEAILINETCETTNKLSREGKELPIVIIGNKRYAECYNGAYYMSLEEKISERFTGVGMEIVEDYIYRIYRIYRINPQTGKWEQGGYIQYVENLINYNAEELPWIYGDAKVCGRATVSYDNKIDGKVSIYSQEGLNNYLNLVELNKTIKATDEITEIIKGKNVSPNFGD